MWPFSGFEFETPDMHKKETRVRKSNSIKIMRRHLWIFSCINYKCRTFYRTQLLPRQWWLDSKSVGLSIVRHLFRTFRRQTRSRNLVGERCRSFQMSFQPIVGHFDRRFNTDRTNVPSKADWTVRRNFESKDCRTNFIGARILFEQIAWSMFEQYFVPTSSARSSRASLIFYFEIKFLCIILRIIN